VVSDGFDGYGRPFMQNESGEVVDTLIPRKCDATNRLIPPHDHAAVQFRISKLNDEGLPTGEYETVIFSGYLRTLGEADNALNRIATEKGLLKGVYRE
jgi:small subunit ribosomal protein S21e